MKKGPSRLQSKSEAVSKTKTDPHLKEGLEHRGQLSHRLYSNTDHKARGSSDLSHCLEVLIQDKPDFVLTLAL